MKRLVGAVCALGLLFAGCAGGGGQAAMLPGNASSAAIGASGGTLIRIHVPWASPSTPPGPTKSGPSQAAFAGLPLATAPSATTVPAAGAAPLAAQTLSLGVSGPTQSTQTISLSPGSSGCAASPPGTLCQAAMALAPGTYTASVTFAGTAGVSPGNGPAAAQAIAFTVPPSGNTVVNLAFATLPAQIALVPASSMSGLNAQGGIDLYGAGKHQLLIEMFDANQNVIVGTGSPSFTLSQSGGSPALVAAQPIAGAPNAVTVTASAASSASIASLRVAATYPAQANNPCLAAGAVCSGSVSVDVRQILAVANSSANSVTLYVNGQPAPVAAIASGVIDPQALVFDASGNLFVANLPGNVTEYAPPYNGPASATVSAGVNHPQALALDGRGDLFVANGSGSNTVTQYPAPYNGGPSATISAGVNDPVSLGLDAAGDLFVVNTAANTVTEFAPPYSGAPTTISYGLNAPSSLAIDGRGNLFVANLNSTPNSVVEYSPPFSARSVPSATITNGINEQGAIGLGGSANLFVPNQGANTVTEYVAPYAGMPTTITGGQSQPVALAIDALGNLYVANYGNNTVTQYAPPYVGGSWTTIGTGVSNPQALALSPATNTTATILP